MNFSKELLAFLFVALVGIAASLELGDEEWKKFKTQFGKTYANKNEEDLRRTIWEYNSNYISEHNKNASISNDNLGFYLKMNEFGDLSNKEFISLVLDNRSRKSYRTHITETYHANRMALPDSVDWRSVNCVGPVINQGQCGSSYAFAVTESLAGVICAKTKKYTSLSVQQLVDCSTPYGNQGCNGGTFGNSFDYIRDYGLESDASYPMPGDGKCNYNKSLVIAYDKGAQGVTPGEETDLTSAIANVGPVTVAFDASQTSFQFYSSGVYYDPNCSQTPDHAALAVGYGVHMEKLDYYIVKNTWGTSWGQNGYVYMSRNRNNNCGIANDAVFPLI